MHKYNLRSLSKRKHQSTPSSSSDGLNDSDSENKRINSHSFSKRITTKSTTKSTTKPTTKPTTKSQKIEKCLQKDSSNDYSIDYSSDDIVDYISDHSKHATKFSKSTIDMLLSSSDDETYDSDELLSDPDLNSVEDNKQKNISKIIRTSRNIDLDNISDDNSQSMESRDEDEDEDEDEESQNSLTKKSINVRSYPEFVKKINNIIVEEENLDKSEQEELLKCTNMLIEKNVTSKKIVNASVSLERKTQMLEKYYTLQMCDPLTESFFEVQEQINNGLSSKNFNISEEMSAKLLLNGFSKTAHEKISIEIESLSKMSTCDSDYHKKKKWIEFVLKIPDHVKDFPIKRHMPVDVLFNFSKQLKNALDENCYGMEEVKDKILDFVFKRISNPDSNKNILCLCGPPGVGKTTIAKCLANVLNLPFVKIALSGSTDESSLTGHEYTYVGSKAGSIITGLVESKCLNPIIYLDEVDKTGNRNGTDEVSNALIHILDPVQNDKFMDSYVGFECDFSQVFWILTLNDMNKINPALADRFNVIQIKGYSKSEKIAMAIQHLIPQIERNIGIEKNKIIVTQECLSLVIELVPVEEGVRHLQRGLEAIYERVNRLIMTGQFNQENSPTLSLTSDHINKFLKNTDSTHEISSMYI